MFLTIFGIIGLVFLAAAWVPQTLHTIRTKETVNLHFNVLYVIGSGLLTIYSLLIHDIVFVVLNGLALLLAGVNLIYSLRT